MASDTPGVKLAAVQDWLTRMRDAVTQQRDYLTELDSAIGDADHGTNLTRGFTAVVEKLTGAPPDGISAMLQATGMTLVSTVGGASGPLYGTFFLRMAKALGDGETVTGTQFGVALRAGLDGLLARGHAELGDKTMVDALDPAVTAFEDMVEGGGSAAQAAASAVTAAADGRDATEPLVARKGRASYLGERSSGHIDPGSASVTLLFEALAAALEAAAPDTPGTDG